VQAERRSHMAAILSALRRDKALVDAPAILLQAVLIPSDKTTEGQLIEAVARPWFEIIALLRNSPEVIYQLDWRKWEEIVAGAYRQQGFEVVLTPRSNDKGHIGPAMSLRPRRSARWLVCSPWNPTSRKA
jgi:hypothetical protein